MFFQSSKSKETYNWLDLRINDKQIKRVDTFNFLGLTLNKRLNWNDHINSIASKISSTVGVLNKLKHFLPTSILKKYIHRSYYPDFTTVILYGGTNQNVFQIFKDGQSE